MLRRGSADEAGFRPESLELVRSRAASWVDGGLTPSLVLLAARRGVIALHEAYGRLTPEPESAPLATDSVFPMSSISKPVTATAVMQLVEAGLLGLSRPVVDYVPELCGKGVEEILVYHLLTHTSGFAELDVNEFTAGQLQKRLELPPREETEHSSVRLLMNARYPLEPAKPAGEVMMYCNHNYDLLGEIVRRVSGHAFEDFVRERVFEPLGMKDSSFRFEERFRGRIVKRGPELQFNPNPAVNLDDERWLDVPLGSGGLISTAPDLAIFAQTILNGGTYGDVRLLSPASVAEMTRNQIEGIPGEGPFGGFGQASYGLGLFVWAKLRWPYLNGDLAPRGTYGHGGGGGVRLWVDPVNEIVGIYLGIITRFHPRFEVPVTGNDLYQNMVTAAVMD